MAEEQTISSEKLEALTGLTDRRHRQIAKLGHFPSPTRGQYKLAPTIKGLFVYYRGMNDNDMKQAKLAEEHRKLKIANDYKERKLILVDSVKACVSRVLARVDQILEQKLSNEYPAAVAGLDVPQSRIYGKRLGDQIRTEFQGLKEEWK
jgi:hypothetical protein